METVNVVIDEVSDSGSEKISEEIPKEILPSEPKVVQEIVDQEPVSPSTLSVVEVLVDIPTSPDSESHEEKGPSCWCTNQPHSRFSTITYNVQVYHCCN